MVEQQQSLLPCYKLSDYPVQEWVSHVWAATDNAQYRERLERTKVMQDLISLFGEPVSNIEDIHTACTKVVQDHDFVSLVLFLWTVYQRENCTGPSIYTQYVEDTRAPLEIGYLPETAFDRLSTKNDTLQHLLLKHYESGGEPFYHKSQLLIALYTLECALDREGQSAEEAQFGVLMKARVSYLKDQSLNSSIAHLKDASLTLFAEYTALLRTHYSEHKDAGSREALALLLAEQSYCQLHFYKYEQSRESVDEAMKVWGLDVQLTGALGKRTIYQTENIAQLTLDIEKQTVNINLQTTDQIYSDQIYKLDESIKDYLAAENILHENGPKFLEDRKDVDLTDTDLALLTAVANQFWRNQLDAEIELREIYMRPYLLALTKNDLRNWLVHSNGLIWRSRSEITRSKTREKSLCFFQGLLDQFRNQTVPLPVKFEFLFALGYPQHVKFMSEVAQANQDQGLFMAAFELYDQVELTEEAVRCLTLAGRQTEAIKKADELLKQMEEKGHTTSLKYASMLCMMGDVRRDTSWYIKAWEVSEQKCARAMRSLARAHFFKNELELAVECYEKAFKINQLYPRELFTCGCAYMKLQRYEKAIYTFGISISIDERDAEAWGNIANCYMALNKISEALQCTENALKINRRNWRLWHNLIKFALAKGEMYRAMFAVNMLIELNQKDGINGALLVKISELFLNKYADDSKLSEEAFLRHKKRLFDFFKNYSNNINDYGVHRLVWKVKGMLGEPAEDQKDYKMRELKSLMTVNWQVRPDDCNLIERALLELDTIYVEGLACSQEERQFVKVTAMAIEDCFKRKCKREDLVQRYS